MSHSSELVIIVQRDDGLPEAPFDPPEFRILHIFDGARPAIDPKVLSQDSTLDQVMEYAGIYEQVAKDRLTDIQWAFELASNIGVGEMLCLEDDPPQSRTFAVRGHLWSEHYSSPVSGDDWDEGFEVETVYEGHHLPSIHLPVPDKDTVATYSRVYKDGEEAEEHWWMVATLHELARDLEAHRVPLETLVDKDFKESWSWEDQMDLEGFMAHTKRVLDAELSYPVLLSADGSIMDGMHRLCKAVILGLDTILVVQFKEDPPPHNIQPVGLEDD